MAAVHLRDVEAVTGIPYKTLTRWAQYGNWQPLRIVRGRKLYCWDLVTVAVEQRQKRDNEARSVAA
jgi:hypothetical protein